MTNSDSESEVLLFRQCLLGLDWIWTNCAAPTHTSRSGTMTSPPLQTFAKHSPVPEDKSDCAQRSSHTTVTPKLAPSPRSLSTFSQASTFSYAFVVLSDKSVCQLVNKGNLIKVNTYLRRMRFNYKF